MQLKGATVLSKMSINIYLAGKIGKGDWRHDIVANLRSWEYESDQFWSGVNIQDLWEWPILADSIFDQFSYAGPFFISCDHGCYHGPNSHGYEDNGCGSSGAFTREQVATLCRTAIQNCDLFFAWIDTTDCYGTITEIGFAASLGKRVVIAGPHRFDDMWFVYEMADDIYLEEDNPAQALKLALGIDEVKADSVREQLLASITETVSDYRYGEIEPITPTHIETWVDQFPEDKQLCILTEMDRILDRYYFSKQTAIDRLTNLLGAEQFFGSNPAEVLKNTKFLSIQRNGSSQEELLELADAIISEKYGLTLSECGDNPQQYIYLDDGLFSGNSARHDCIEWLPNAIKGSTLHFIFFITHDSGLSYFKRKINQEARKHNVSIKYWSFKKVDDRQDAVESYWPALGNYTEQVMQYADTLLKRCEDQQFDPRLFRPDNRPEQESVFSSIEARDIITSAFLEAGVTISNLSQGGNPNLRPLGYEYLESFGFGSFFVSYRNIPNNCPLALWWGNPNAPEGNSLRDWYPLFMRKVNN